MQTFLSWSGYGETEVDQANRVVGSDHDIVGLDIPVHDVLRVRVVNRLKETLHVSRSLPLREHLVLLLADLVKQGHARDILHDQVNVHSIVVSLIILHDIRMIQRVQSLNLIHDIAKILAKSIFVQDFNGDFDIRIMLICCQEDLAKGSCSEHLRLMINVIVLFQLMDALLSKALSSDELLPVVFILLNRRFKTSRRGLRVEAAHFVK